MGDFDFDPGSLGFVGSIPSMESDPRVFCSACSVESGHRRGSPFVIDLLGDTGDSIPSTGNFL